MNIEPVEYEADGVAMKGWLVYRGDLAGPRPGVLVYPPAPGPGRQMMTSAEGLAELGYVAMVCDLYGGGRFYEDLTPALELLAPLRADAGRVRARARGAFDVLAGSRLVDASRIGATGYCFGGLSALELARDGADLRVVVGFHTPLHALRRDESGDIGAAILICTGAEDREASAEARAGFEAEMRRRGVKDWAVHVYGEVWHSFTNPDADAYNQPDYARYDARAHRRSWREMTAWLDEAMA